MSPRLLLLLTLLPCVAAAAPFDLRAMRTEHPGAQSVILEREHRVTRPDPHTLRVSVRSTRAILDDLGSRSLSLFSQDERPGCRTPAGVRIEVETPRGETLVTTMDDLVRLTTDPWAVWTGPRKGVATGALVHESYHVDYGVHCSGGVLDVQGTIGADVPVMSERVVVECEDCFLDVGGPGDAAFARDEDRWVLDVRDVVPAPTESKRPEQTMQRWYVSTSGDPTAWGRLLAAELPARSKAWARDAAGWARWAREKGAGMDDKTAALAYGLSRIGVFSGSTVWKYGSRWGEPVGAESRSLRPLEWWALVNQLLGNKAVPVLWNDADAEVVDGAASVVDWDEYGFLLPGLGLLTTTSWQPFVGGQSANLRGGTMMVLDGPEPRLERLTLRPESRVRHFAVQNEPSGVASVLVTVDRTDSSAWGLKKGQAWQRREHAVKKSKADLGEIIREWAASAWFGGRRVTVTTITAQPDGVQVQSGWTQRDVLVRGDGYVLMPVSVYGLPTDLRGVGDERQLPIVLGARTLTGEVRVILPSGYQPGGLPPAEAVDEGPLHFEATWRNDSGVPVLSWSLRYNDNIVPASMGSAVSRLGAALDRVGNAQLVLRKQ